MKPIKSNIGEPLSMSDKAILVIYYNSSGLTDTIAPFRKICPPSGPKIALINANKVYLEVKDGTLETSGLVELESGSPQNSEAAAAQIL